MRKLLFLIALAVPLVVGVSSVFAATSYIRIYEDANGQGDSKSFGVALPNISIPHLGQVPHTQEGPCNAPIKWGDNWNDCVSSWRVTLAYGECVALFRDINYQNEITRIRGPLTGVLYNMHSADNDTLSSIAVGYVDSSMSPWRCDRN